MHCAAHLAVPLVTYLLDPYLLAPHCTHACAHVRALGIGSEGAAASYTSWESRTWDFTYLDANAAQEDAWERLNYSLTGCEGRGWPRDT